MKREAAPTMGSMDLDATIEAVVEGETGRPFRIVDRSTAAGGCISEAFRVRGEDGRSWFVKVNRRIRLPLFEAEASGLRAMAETKTVRVPSVVGTGESGGAGFIVMEALELGGHRAGSADELGRLLAEMHRAMGPGFGFEADNFIGETPQLNTPMSDDWPSFFAGKRLEPQFRWAREKGLRIEGSDTLLESIEAFFRDYRPVPSLLHGDLWGGNIDTDEHGHPVLYDPAAYYGDREADIAFTELFGGPGEAFYRSYREHWPLDEGYPVRKTLYNLYHIVNHFNHFGGRYGAQARSMVRELLTELKR